MRRQRGLVELMGLAALVGLGVLAKPAVATVTTENSASILVFPKVIACTDPTCVIAVNGVRNTIIQITNTSNSIRYAHCFYVDAELTDPTLPEGPNNLPLWTETDFDIVLTKQQPTHWVVSTGRFSPATEPLTCRNVNCNPATSGGVVPPANCCDSGLDPGRVPPVSPTFQGELKCIEVDASGAPEGGNALKGEATIEDPITGDVSKYNAVGLKGFDNQDRNNTLCLGAGPTEICPMGAEYESCPDRWYIDAPVVGAADTIASAFCPPGVACTAMNANLTVVPCSEDFEHQSPQDIVLQFIVTNEFEQSFSNSTTFRCWKSIDLATLSTNFTVGTLGGSVSVSRMTSLLAPTSTTPLGPPPGAGVIPILEESHTLVIGPGGSLTRAAQNVHSGPENKTAADYIVIPGGQGGDLPQ